MEKNDLEECPKCGVDLSSFGDITRLSYCPQCQHPVMLLAGKYRIIKALAEGGFGKVYLAKRIKLKRDAERVVKVIKPEVFAMEGMEERFWREVQVTSALSQRSLHIVRIYDDFGHEPGFGHYYVMEYLRGKPLKEYLDNTPRVPYRIAVHMMKQICDGLRIAHREGVIHRDLKPDNIFVLSEEDGTYFLKLIDWGIAKPIDWSSVGQDLTQGAVGTPRYMAPEQCLGQEIDHRADIYALGVILYEMLTGKPLFPLPAGEGSAPLLALLHSHVTEEPTPISERCPDLDLPDGLEAAVMKAIAKRPEKRFNSVEIFGDIITSCDEQAKTRAELKGLPTVESMAFDHTMLAALESVTKQRGRTDALPEHPRTPVVIDSLAVSAADLPHKLDETHHANLNAQDASQRPTPAPHAASAQMSPLELSGMGRSYPGLGPQRRRKRKRTALFAAVIAAALVLAVGAYFLIIAKPKVIAKKAPSVGLTKQKNPEPAPLHRTKTSTRAKTKRARPRPTRRKKRSRRRAKKRIVVLRKRPKPRPKVRRPIPTPRRTSGPCGQLPNMRHWIFGKMKTPRGKSPKVLCNRRRMPVIWRKGGFCIGLMHGRNYSKCKTTVPSYRPCTHPLRHSMKTITWRLKEELSLMGVSGSCYSSN